MENILAQLPSGLLELGIGGVVALLIIKEVFSFMKGVRMRRNGVPVKCEKCAAQVQALFDMHNQKDADGVYIWYVRRSLEDAINKLADDIQHQTNVFVGLVGRIKEKVGD